MTVIANDSQRSTWKVSYPRGVPILNKSVSVIIPVFNGGRFIAQAVQSALEQTVVPREIIVVNDGSFDNTLEILVRFGSRIKVISIPNGGVSNARNVGINASSCAIIAFLDADDQWYRDKLEKQLLVMQEYPEAGFCCCNYLVRNRYDDHVVNQFDQFANEGDLIFDKPLASGAFDLLLKFNFVGTCSSVVVRRSILEMTGLFNVDLKQSEDVELWFRCALVTRFVVVGTSLFEKRTHDTNLTSNFLETLQCHERVLEALSIEHGELLAKGSRLEILRSALAKTRYEIGNELYERGKHLAAFHYFYRGLYAWNVGVNRLQFLRHVCRKMVRLLTFGIVRNRAWRREI